MTPTSIFCQNITTGVKLHVSSSATSWDCEAMGLVVKLADVVVTGAGGTAN
jgi:hypothetical protein